MSAQQDYVVLTQIHETRWEPQLQQAIEGWTIRVRDSVTGVVLPVFVADDFYTVDGTRQLIEAALAPVRAIAQLGTPAAKR